MDKKKFACNRVTLQTLHEHDKDGTDDGSPEVGHLFVAKWGRLCNSADVAVQIDQTIEQLSNSKSLGTRKRNDSAPERSTECKHLLQIFGPDI